MKILFVCLGNICRSPMADAIMLKMLNDKKLNHEIDSAGTQSYHVGSGADKRAVRTCYKHGIDLRYHEARQISKADFKYYDLIFTMATDVHRIVLSLTESEDEKMKVIQFMDELIPNQNLSVPDPWYGDEAGFEPVFELIQKGCRKILIRLS
jgi:protein-tyrosine phosphatase